MELLLSDGTNLTITAEDRIKAFVADILSPGNNGCPDKLATVVEAAPDVTRVRAETLLQVVGAVAAHRAATR